MNRYSDTPLYKTAAGIQYQGLTRYPEIPATDQDIYVYVTDGDRLDNLANAFYGDPTLYWIISAANPDLPLNSLFPTPGAQLRLPASPEQIINSFNNLNNG
jgi:hypothetical protein